MLWLTMAASLSFLVIGLVRGYSSSAIPSMEAFDGYLVPTSEHKSWIGAIPPLGAFAGSLVSGPLMQRCGRRSALLWAAPLWAAAWALLALAPNFSTVLGGRILTGFCVGLVLASAQVYVSECCDASVRGGLGSVPTLCMSGGILASYILGHWLYWRHLAFVSAAVCVLLFFALLPLPESPAWLAARGADPRPSIAWLHLSAAPVTPTEKREIERTSSEPGLFTREVFFSSPVAKPLAIGFALLAFQQVSGIDAVIFFTVEIFRSAGSSLNASTATIIVGAVQLACNGLSTLLVDAAGRKPLLLVSATVMAASLTSMGAAFFFQLEQESWLGYLPLASLIVFMIGFSLGFGGLPFLLLGELFPAKHRSQLSAMAGSVNLLVMFVVIKTYHLLQEVITSAGTFWVYAGCCALGFFFVLLFVPETKGKTLEEIEMMFASTNKAKSPDNCVNSKEIESSKL